MKNIYFCGSIRGGRKDAEIYGVMINELKKYGAVLTEHVGLASLGEEGSRNMSEAEIYERDAAWLRQSDLVVAECSTPSTGVGYELAYAESLGKPVFAFYNPASEKKLSAMIAGDEYFTVIRYADAAELPALLERICTERAD